jgi:diacylglycerol kinase (ATP)
MKRATLLYNPTAGRAQSRNVIVQAIVDQLKTHGIDATAICIEGPNTAATQAREAIATGSDTIFACGGDGTVHAVLQGLIHQPAAVLGIIPLGSANVLARHLDLSMDPLEAALQQLTYIPQTIPVGELTTTTPDGPKTQAFLTLAGAGPDGALAYRVLAQNKRRFGRILYYLHAMRLFTTARFRSFAVEATLSSGEVIHRRAISAMTVRVNDLGGLFSPLIRGGALHHPHLRLSLLRGPASLAIPTWIATSWTQLHRINRFTETLDVVSFRCAEGESARVYVQADGEALGYTPARARIVHDALRLLMPASA